MGELLAAEAGATVDRSPDDLREVGNYVVALEHGISRLKKLPLCVRLARELHEKLMTGVRGHRAAPGQFRKIQNWIGKPGSTIATASYMPPPPGEIEPCLAAWEGFMHESAPPQYSPITKPDFDQVSERRNWFLHENNIADFACSVIILCEILSLYYARLSSGEDAEISRGDRRSSSHLGSPPPLGMEPDQDANSADLQWSRRKDS
ncbi:MAG: hypothetical protein DMG70_29695 [Acidobacteria bacterium]|nr:MAG: hypothetical protein DMG70_29695 [Acidobacteriota bacterium]